MMLKSVAGVFVATALAVRAAYASPGDNVVAGIQLGDDMTAGEWFQNGHPNNLTNGNRTDSYDHWGATPIFPWFYIYWRSDVWLGSIKLYGRPGYQARMINATITIYDADDEIVWREVIDAAEIVEEDHSGLRPTWSMTFDPVFVGRYINVDGENYLNPGVGIDRNVFAIAEIELIETEPPPQIGTILVIQ